jgi:hypothetical protein
MNKLVNNDIPKYHPFNQMLMDVKKQLMKVFPICNDKKLKFFEDELFYSWNMKASQGCGLWKELDELKNGRILVDSDTKIILIMFNGLMFQYEFETNMIYLGLNKRGI